MIYRRFNLWNYQMAFLSLFFIILILASCSRTSPTAPEKTIPLSAQTDRLGTAEFRGPKPVDRYDAAVPLAWFNLAYQAVKNERLSPPFASRILGYMGVSLYEAVVPGMPGYQSLAGQLNGLAPLPKAHGLAYHWSTVANSALLRIMKGMFEGKLNTLQAISSLYSQFANQYQSTLPPGLYQRSADFGNSIGQAILDWSKSDGYALFNNCTANIPVGPGFWVPTPPGFLPPLQPCWGKLRPFVLSDGSQCDPGPPPAYSEAPASQCYQEANEVYQTVNNLSPEQMTIALYWADNPGETGTPPGHSISILNQIIESRHLSLAVAAEAYAKVGMAVADAFISCWWSKYQYNFLRPITYIRNLIDPNWTTPIVTPPFPEYTSGHSAQSGAAAQVLTDLFGEIAFTDHTHDNRGFAPRTFDSFFEAAQEAAISRLYGGIHFRTAIEKGIQQGKCIGQQVSALQFKALLP